MLADPEYVLWKGRPKKVIGVIRAKHQGHRYYILGLTKRANLYPGAHTTALAKRGKVRRGWPRGSIGIVIRSDAVKPYDGRPRRGRPKK